MAITRTLPTIAIDKRRPAGSMREAAVGAARVAAHALGVRKPRVLRGERLEEPLLALIVRTARLELRPHRMSDAADWYAIQSNPAVLRYLAWPMRNEAESRRHLRDRVRHSRLEQADDFLALGIEKDGILIGDVSLHLRDVASEARAAEIGWVLNPDFGGKGYATEAADALLRLAFGRLGARFVTAEIEPGNERSIALAKRLGFVEGGGKTMMITPELCRAARQRRINSIPLEVINDGESVA